MAFKPTKREIRNDDLMYQAMTGKLKQEDFEKQYKEPKQRTYHEADEQMAFVAWCMMSGYPYNKIFAVENEGATTPQAGARAKKMGKRSGVSDLLLLVPRGQYFGLALEMKSLTGTMSDNQKAFAEFVQSKGYCFECCHGADQARAAIIKYNLLGKFSIDKNN